MKAILPNESIAILEILLERSQFFSSIGLDREPSIRGELNVSTSSSYMDQLPEGELRPFWARLEVEVTLSHADKTLAHGRASYVGSFQWRSGFDLSEEVAKVELAPMYLYGFCREHLADLARRSGLVLVLPPTRFSRPSGTLEPSSALERPS